MEQNPKQVVAERIRSGSSVLVTVSKDPSVDQLASAIGLTLMLNALGKHTTAVFSGKIPSTVEFLRPEETFDTTVDGLRDFIISLDKEKADKLRYKVEDDIVKIFITPYKNKLSEKDLEFSQGDYNVDLVIALGVTKRDELDEAITAHGRILHDATIITINAGAALASGVGAVDWSDPNASCLSEMLVSISEALQGGILDAAMSTAFLTGIVAETDRFKNDKTTPKLMTMSAQLMAAGANQQLIASNLQLDATQGDKVPVNEVSLRDDAKPDESSEEAKTEATNSSDQKNDDSQPTSDTPSDKPAVQEGTFDLEKAKENITDDTSLEQIEKELKAEHKEPKPEPENEVVDESILKLEEELAQDSSSTLDAIENKLDTARGATEKKEEKQRPDGIGDVKGRGPLMENDPAPSLGGTFNATSEEAHNAVDQERQKGLNTEVFSHRVEPASVEAQTAGAPEPGAIVVDDARRAVEAAMQAQPYTPDNKPIESLGAQSLPGEGLENLPPMQNDPNAYAQPPMPPVIQSQPYPPMQQQTFAPLPPQPFNNQPQQQMPPPMPQQTPIMPTPQQQMPTPSQQPMYQTPPPQPYPPQNNGSNGTPPQMPPGGPPPMPQF